MTPPQGAARPHRSRLTLPAKLAILIAVLACALLSWRAVLPSNRHRDLDTFAEAGPRQSYALKWIANTYDECVTQVTARNFLRDGFWHTRLLANRGGYPLASLYDISRTQCDNPAPPQNVIRYDFGNGKGVDMKSLNNDCVYSHFPPLADWIFALFARVGLNQYIHYRLLAIGLNCA